MCECDKQFAEEISLLWRSDDDNDWNEDYSMDNFVERDQQCVSILGGNEMDQCCGQFPDRRPYASAFYECCPNGDIKSTGSC